MDCLVPHYTTFIPDLIKHQVRYKEKLHNRRAGVEAIIGHIKHMGQMNRSRMKSDRTTLSGWLCFGTEIQSHAA